jgi:hypothetical protein
MKTGNQADLRRYLESEYQVKVTKVAISKRKKTKPHLFILTPEGKIVLEETAKALINDGIDKNAGRSSKKNTEPPEKPEITKADREDEKEKILQEYISGEKQVTLASPDWIIRRYRDFQSAEKERIANQKAEKELVNFNVTADTVFNFLRPFRDDCMEIGKRISAIAFQSGSKREAQKVIDDEVQRIFKSRVGNDYKFDDELKKKIIEVLRTSLQRQ